MTKRKASFCPYCGAALEPRTFEGRERMFCPDCEAFVWQNPVPVGCVVVLDGDEALFIERALEPDCGAWAVPGGIFEVDEPAAVGAARELEEEAGLSVAPDDLELVRTGFDSDGHDGGSVLSICFAVERGMTNGEPSPGPETTAARFWKPGELLAGDEQTRTVDGRRIEAAFERLRGETRPFPEQ